MFDYRIAITTLMNIPWKCTNIASSSPLKLLSPTGSLGLIEQLKVFIEYLNIVECNKIIDYIPTYFTARNIFFVI